MASALAGGEPGAGCGCRVDGLTPQGRGNPPDASAQRPYRSSASARNASARALGGYGERVTQPTDIIPAIKHGLEATQSGTPALLEFITQKDHTYSTFGR